MKKNSNDNRTHYMLKLLKKEFCHKSEITLDSNSSYLAASIWIDEELDRQKIKRNNVSDMINESTLRKWWQNDSPNHIPNRSKLSLIAKCLGYKDWDSFCEIKDRHTTIHSLYDPLEFKIENMKIGDEYLAGWFPQYYVLFEYIGENKLKVIDCSSNTKIKIGQEKEIYGFGISYVKHMDTVHDNQGKKYEAEGYPLYPSIIIRTRNEKHESQDNFENSYIHIIG